MRGQPFVATLGPRSAPARRLLLLFLLAVFAVAASSSAQSVLGTLRGTVTDPQGAVVAKVAVMIVDEATGIPRTIETDTQGRYEAANLRPGTYRVEVVTSNFKKYERTGVVVRTGGVALVEVKLELGGLNETVSVSAEALNNIVLESPAVAGALDAQQLQDLPRSSRDMQSFLFLNPNVLGGSDDLQFLGGRTYGVSYVQDGQASTNAIFGTIGNSAPGLDAIAEVQVLSNSYSAEYGGLAGVVVTTKRGGNAFRGSAFYDFNSDGLNALTYNQKLAGAERGDPNSATHQHRWGGSFGGPLKSNKTFFFASYEGSNDKAIYGGGRANVPTAAMRNGDFSATTIVLKDPLTGLPFPGNVIPANRIDPSAQKILDFFYPLPNRGTLATGMGVFQEFLPETRNSQRADLRIDHEFNKNNSLFVRGSYRNQDPSSIQFEGGNLVNLGLRDVRLKTGAAVAGWTRIFSSTVVNELRVGYNYDNSVRASNYNVQAVNAQLGLETAPSVGPDRVGFPAFSFAGGASSTRPVNISDGGYNADRTVTQNAFSISDNLTWIMGAHSMKAGALWNRNYAIDGRGRGVSVRGSYAFSGTTGTQTGNALGDLLLGAPRTVSDVISTRGNTDGHSDDYAFFVQDDWRVNTDLTVFLGLRYELQGAWHEKGDILGNFLACPPGSALWDQESLPTGQTECTAYGGHHVVPNAQVAALLPPGVIALGRTQTAAEAGISDNLINTDKNNFSPRVGFAWRLGADNKTVLRGGFGLFHPTVAIQGIRDSLASNMFRYPNTRQHAPLQQGFSGGTSFVDPSAYGNQGINPNLQSPDIYQYNVSFERELPGNLGLRASYIGATMRKLLVDRDAETIPASTEFFNGDFSDPESRARLPYPIYGTYMDQVVNTGSGQLHAFQVELRRRWKDGLAVDIAYTLAHSNSNAPDSGNSTVGVVQFDPYDITKDEGPDPNVVKHRVVMNATWDIPVGHGRSHGADMPGWANALFGGWTVSTLVQAKSGNNLTPFFTSFYTTSPWNTGKPLDGLGGNFCCAWRPDQVGNPNGGGSRDAFFNQQAYALPAPGKLGNAGKGSLLGPGTWVVNFGIYKDIVAKGKFRLQFSALLDNAFNHPQFFVPYGDGFAQLDDWLINGDPNNGTTGVLGSGSILNQEGFATGRVVRLGIRATF